MPYWSIYCLYCRGYIADALLECLPAAKRSMAAYRLLFQTKPLGVLDWVASIDENPTLRR